MRQAALSRCCARERSPLGNWPRFWAETRSRRGCMKCQRLPHLWLVGCRRPWSQHRVAPPGGPAQIAAVLAQPPAPMHPNPDAADIQKFAIGFDRRDRARLHDLWDEVIDSEQWTEGQLTKRFEEAWERWNGLQSVATSGWSGAALAALEFAEVRGKKVLCPSNTFMATVLAIQAAGGEPVFVDCNREDLCMSFADFEAKVDKHSPAAAVLVHIGGHIAFDSERIAALCRDR